MTSEKVARKTGHTVNADRTCALIAAAGGVAGVLVVDEEVAEFWRGEIPKPPATRPRMETCRVATSVSF
jgi:hypothetical protein